MSSPPNIVLIVADQWRGDALSSAGHPVVQTAHLDPLALGGCRFSGACFAASSCIIIRGFTGLGQRPHGRDECQDRVPRRYPAKLAGKFTRPGDRLRNSGKKLVFSESARLGFEHVVLRDGCLHYARGLKAELRGREEGGVRNGRLISGQPVGSCLKQLAVAAGV